MLAMAIPYIVQSQMQESVLRFFVVCSLSILCTIFVLYNWGINKDVRIKLNEKLHTFLKFSNR